MTHPRSSRRRPPLPKPHEVQAAYLPDVPLNQLTQDALGKPEAQTPAEVFLLNDHMRREGNARTARQGEAQGQREADLSAEELSARGTAWLGL